eukprot:1813698-Pyramimonas_sp.AAC.1
MGPIWAGEWELRRVPTAGRWLEWQKPPGGRVGLGCRPGGCNWVAHQRGPAARLQAGARRRRMPL